MFSIICQCVGVETPPTELKRSDILDRAKTAVVIVVPYDAAGKKLNTGTGFVISEDGLVATAWHVIAGAAKVKAMRQNGAALVADGVVAWDVVQDYAILKVSGKKLPYLDLGDSDALTPGQKVIAVGKIVGIEQLVVDGTISAMRTPPSAPKLMQITAKVQPRAAGGPVLNMAGEVIGVASCLSAAGQDVSFAVPINVLKPVLTGDIKVTPVNKIVPDEASIAKSLYLKGMLALPENSKVTDAKKKYEAALGLFLQAVDKKKDYAKARFYAAYCLALLGRNQEAIDSYKRTVRIKPDYADAYFGMGLTYVNMGYIQDAVQSFQEAIHLNPDFADAHYNLALLYVQQGWSKEAEESLKQVIRIDPNYVEAYYNLGVGYVEQGKYASAVDSFKQAIRIKPDLSQAYFGLGIALMNQGFDQDASDAFKQIIRITPDNANAHFSLGQCYMKLSRYQDAVDSLKQAIRLDPQDADAYCQIGAAYDKLGRSDDAMDSYKQASRIDPTSASALYNLGAMYVQRQDRSSALETYKSLKALDPTLAEKLFKLIYP